MSTIDTVITPRTNSLDASRYIRSWKQNAKAYRKLAKLLEEMMHEKERELAASKASEQELKETLETTQWALDTTREAKAKAESQVSELLKTLELMEDYRAQADRETQRRMQAEASEQRLREAYDELREFVRYSTLEIQQHRGRSDAQKDALFGHAYRLYVKHDVENSAALAR